MEVKRFLANSSFFSYIIYVRLTPADVGEGGGGELLSLVYARILHEMLCQV